MSALMAVFRRAATRVDLGTFQQGLRSMAARGRDGVGQVSRPRAALGVQQLWSTPEDLDSHQPSSCLASRCFLVFDGRLDDRESLVAALGDSEGDLLSRPDGDLVLAAYNRWGPTFCEHLLGPYALVLLDERNSQLVCARDPLGGRTLFYSLDRERLIVASEARAVLADPSASRALDRETVQEYFRFGSPDDERTFFQGVRELRPGTCLVVSPWRERRFSTWSPGDKTVRYRRDAEYGEHLLELLRQGVADRSRTLGSPAILMSGGLDSTSVAALTHRHQADRGAEPPRTITWTFDDLPCDERAAVEAFHGSYPGPASFLPGDRAWPLRRPDLLGTNPGSPEDNPYRELKTLAYREAAGHGHRTLLTGVFGDNASAGSVYWLIDLLREGRWLAAASDLTAELRRRGLRGAVRASGLPELIRGGLGRRGDVDRAPWLKWSGAWEARSAGPVAGRRPLWHALAGARTARNASLERVFAEARGVDLRHPYRDRRLVEFFLGLPGHQLYRRGQFKVAARSACADLLPRRILDAGRPGRLDPLFQRGIREKEADRARRILEAGEDRWSGFVRPDWVRAALAPTAAGTVADLVLWQVLAFSLWRPERCPHAGQRLAGVRVAR